VRGKTVGVLVAVDGELEGEVFRVPDGESRLGRSEGCEVPLPSEWISREHAKVKHQDGMFVIAPLSDKNPTFVNDERTEGTELKDGDFVRLGRTTFRFRTVF
jgi:predicted component of type VI protein secretion system